MGELAFFNLGELRERFGADTFFETGTGYGFGVMHARQFDFREIYSVDIISTAAEFLRPVLCPDVRVHLIAGKSIDAMREHLPRIEGNIIFWLDAHYPGAHHRLNAYDAEPEIDTRLPLERELSIIRELRAGKRDVILIDDLRIYERDDFKMGNLSDEGLDHIGKYDSRFLYDTLRDTHEATRYLDGTGYLMLTPR